MSCPFDHGGHRPSRRGLLAAAGGLLAAGTARAQATGPALAQAAEPFHGVHQSGIATAQQKHQTFASFDLVAKSGTEIVALLRAWTAASIRLTAGQSAEAGDEDLSAASADGGSAQGLSPERLTLTFGFGPGLFSKDGNDRYGLAAQRPAALVDLPTFHGDQLDPVHSGGDLSVQACADDPQVAFHAIRVLTHLASGSATLRWLQAGFLPNTPAGQTPRNLMGFKDGTNNSQPGHPPTSDMPSGFDDVVWAGSEGPDWMRGGSYLVARRIRISLEHWDKTPVDFQEEVIGRHKRSGAPIGKKAEHDTLGLEREDDTGAPVIAETAHVRLGAPSANGGAQILRRAYSYNDGATFTAERWPPWRQGVMLDAGLLFLAYQRDPRIGFIRIFETMAKMDALNQYTTHNASAVFACPPGVREGEFIGQALFKGNVV